MIVTPWPHPAGSLCEPNQLAQNPHTTSHWKRTPCTKANRAPQTNSQTQAACGAVYLAPILLLVALLTQSVVAHAQTTTVLETQNNQLPACHPDDAICLQQAAEVLAQTGALDDAYLAIERAAMLAPKNPRIRHTLARILAHMGSVDTARDLISPAQFAGLTFPDAAAPLLTPEPNPGAKHRADFGLGWSSNRSLQPRLDSLTLDIPGASGTYQLLKPLDPNPGPLMWLGWAWRPNLHNEVDLRLITATGDQAGEVGQVWSRVEHTLDHTRIWRLRGEFYQRLNEGQQFALALNMRTQPLGSWLTEVELGLRNEHNNQTSRYLDTRLTLAHPLPLGNLAANLHRVTYLGNTSNLGGGTGDQWRTTLAWTLQAHLGTTRATATLHHRHTRDDDPYHPYLANAQPRWQTVQGVALQIEQPQSAKHLLWAQITGEQQKSNIAFYQYNRVELWTGISYAW